MKWIVRQAAWYLEQDDFRVMGPAGGDDLLEIRSRAPAAVFTARAPKDAGARKDDATEGGVIAILNYGSGMPFNRLQELQRSVEIPLPASTQWLELLCAFRIMRTIVEVDETGGGTEREPQPD